MIAVEDLNLLEENKEGVEEEGANGVAEQEVVTEPVTAEIPPQLPSLSEVTEELVCSKVEEAVDTPAVTNVEADSFEPDDMIKSVLEPDKDNEQESTDQVPTLEGSDKKDDKDTIEKNDDTEGITIERELDQFEEKKTIMKMLLVEENGRLTEEIIDGMGKISMESEKEEEIENKTEKVQIEIEKTAEDFIIEVEKETEDFKKEDAFENILETETIKFDEQKCQIIENDVPNGEVSKESTVIKINDSNEGESVQCNTPDVESIGEIKSEVYCKEFQDGINKFDKYQMEAGKDIIETKETSEPNITEDVQPSTETLTLESDREEYTEEMEFKGNINCLKYIGTLEKINAMEESATLQSKQLIIESDKTVIKLFKEQGEVEVVENKNVTVNEKECEEWEEISDKFIDKSKCDISDQTTNEQVKDIKEIQESISQINELIKQNNEYEQELPETVFKTGSNKIPTFAKAIALIVCFVASLIVYCY